MAGILRRESALTTRAGHSPSYSLAELFQENSKLRRIGAIGSPTNVPYGARELEAMACAYKRYRRHPAVPLPAVPSELGRVPLSEVIAARRTHRTFAPDELPLAELSSILQWSYGITGEATLPGGGVQPLRAVPSAGALYPAEIYVGVRAVQGLDAGIYHYEVPTTSLAQLTREDPTREMVRVCCGQEHARHAAAVVFISAMFGRTTRKYGNRGYRFVLLDIGHLAQNLCLACTALDLSIVTTCGFFDEEAAQLLGIDGREEAVMYVAFVGKRGPE